MRRLVVDPPVGRGLGVCLFGRGSDDALERRFLHLSEDAAVRMLRSHRQILHAALATPLANRLDVHPEAPGQTGGRFGGLLKRLPDAGRRGGAPVLSRCFARLVASSLSTFSLNHRSVFISLCIVTARCRRACSRRQRGVQGSLRLRDLTPQRRTDTLRREFFQDGVELVAHEPYPAFTYTVH
jgi:hypothetical protein